MTLINSHFPRRAGFRLRERVAAVVASVGVVAASLVGVAAPVAAQDKALQQTVTADEVIIPRGNPVEITAGHVDIGPLFVDNQLQLLFRDDTTSPPVWRYFADAVFVLDDLAANQLPDDPAYGFVGAKPQAQVWAVPQNQVAGVPWIGWNTQSPAVTETFDRGVTFEFGPHQGPGKASIFVQSGGFSGPQVIFDSDVNDIQPMFVPLHTHTHVNWVFTDPGVHGVTVTVVGDTTTGENLAAQATLVFAVADSDLAGAHALATELNPVGNESSSGYVHDHDHDHGHTTGDGHDHAATDEHADHDHAATPAAAATTTQEAAAPAKSSTPLMILGIVLVALAVVLVALAVALNNKKKKKALGL